MAFDTAKYLSRLDSIEASDERKLDMIGTLRAILTNFVDRAFGIDPAQVAMGISRDNRSAPLGHGVNLKGLLTGTFNNGALA